MKRNINLINTAVELRQGAFSMQSPQHYISFSVQYLVAFALQSLERKSKKE